MRLLLALAAPLLLAACGTTDPSTGAPRTPDPTTTAAAPTATTTATTTAGTRHTGTSIEQPPPFRVQYDGHELALRPHTYCYGDGCVDGVATDPPDIGAPAEVRVHVPVARFELSVFAREITREPRADRPFADVTCGGRSFEVPVEDLGDGWYALRPAGPAGHYDLELFAQGGGDMIGALRWRTPTDGPMPEPTARLALIAEHDGEPDSYGLELAIDDLATTPRRASAEIEVTAGNGRSLTFDVAQPRQDRCQSAGDLYFDRPDAPAREASRLGDFPFTTTVTLTLDGRTHRATAVYPDDEIRGNEPSVALEFTPALPGL